MKKTYVTGFIAVVCAAVLALSSPFVLALSYGDIDESGKVNSADARRILRHSAKLELLTGKALQLADTDGNGRVNSADARIVLRVAARLDDAKEFVDDQTTAPTTVPTPPTTVPTPPTTVPTPPTTVPTPPTTVPPTPSSSVQFVPNDDDIPSVDIGDLG